MIEVLDPGAEAVAIRIHQLFQQAYRLEARLIGAEDFPPLRRTVAQIRSAATHFNGIRIEAELVALVEYHRADNRLCIDSLVVQPEYLRRGLAGRLLADLLGSPGWRTAEVETAAANRPAIQLYRRFGFRETQHWHVERNLEMVRLTRMRTS